MNRKKYKKPEAMDLSGFGVVGYEPLGMCRDGSIPTTVTCANGYTPEEPDPSCTPNGGLPEYGKCLYGSTVSHTCKTGGSPNL